MKRTLLAACLAACAVPAVALAQGLVERLPDGSLRVTSDVGDTVTFPPGSLGTMIEEAWATGGAKPFEGVNVAVVTLAAGARGAISGGILPWEAAWEELTGSTLDVVQKPFNDLAPVIFNDLFTGTGAYDGFIPPMIFLGDMKDFLQPINDYLCDPRFPTVFTPGECAEPDPTQWGVESTLNPTLQPIYRSGDQWYAVPWDTDSHVLYYRRDVMESPEVAAMYRADTGRDLALPASLQELKDLACWFDGRDVLGTGTPIHGIVEPGALNSQIFDWYKDIAGPWVYVHDGADGGFYESFHFDPDTMEPLISSPGHVAALEWMVEIYQCGPDDFASIDLGSSFNRFVQGEAVFAWSAGDIAALAWEPASKVTGVLGAMVIPGSELVYNPQQDAMVAVTPANGGYNISGASWSGEVSSLTEHPEATYALFAFLGSPPMHEWNVKWGFDGIDIGRPADFLPPDGTADIAIYLAGGANEADARQVSKAYFDNLTGTPFEYFPVPGAAEYNLSLEIAVQETLTGQISPQDALARVYKEWEDITERLGRDEQRAVYRSVLGLDAAAGG